MNADAELQLARQEIRSLQPYSSARMEAEAAAVMLNANEAPWTAPGDALHLNRYPEPQPRTLRRELAELYGIEPDQLLIGRGSDEAIDLLVRAFCRAGRDAVVVCPPTFGMYAVCAAVQGARVVEVPLDEQFGLVTADVIAACDESVKLVFVCSPNNPTGNCLPLADIEQLAAALRGRALVVIDEAYIEFSAVPSATGLLTRYPNLVVLRTLSKAWALAGARIGSLLAHPDIVALLRRIMPPYPVPVPSTAAALLALSAAPGMRKRVDTIVSERERFAAALQTFSDVIRVLPSQANFLTAFFTDARSAFERLCSAGIVVRDLQRYPRLQQALRITVGTPAENDVLLSALGKAVRTRNFAS